MTKQMAIILMGGSLLLASCFKEESLNAECDILEASVSVAHAQEVFFHESDTLVHVNSEDNSIVFPVRRSADLTQLSPRFKISEGGCHQPSQCVNPRLQSGGCCLHRHL